MHGLFVATHVGGGAAGLLLGLLAAALPKRAGWHPRAGLGYQGAVALVCVSAFGLIALHPAVWWLGVIAVATEAAAVGGWVYRPSRRPDRVSRHIRFMGASYISLLTAFAVVNIGSPVAWVLPTALGSPVILAATRRAHSTTQSRPSRPLQGTRAS